MMKFPACPSRAARRPSPVLLLLLLSGPLLRRGLPRASGCRGYATHTTLGTAPGAAGPSPSARRKAVTPLNDDGQVPWSRLSAAERAGRVTQQTFNYGLIVAGLFLTAGIGYLLYTDVLAPDSKTAHFNRAVDKIKRNQQCVKVLGDPSRITAHGDNSSSRWNRNRRIASTTTTDGRGNEHLILRFFVEGPLNTAEAHGHFVRASGQSEYRCRYLYMDAPGHSRIWLENADAARASRGKKKPFKVFGMNLG